MSKWIAGQCYKTSDGRKALLAAVLPESFKGRYCIVGTVEDCIFSWTPKGHFYLCKTPSPNDLTLEEWPEEKGGWE